MATLGATTNVASRRKLIAMIVRRQKPGTGSHVDRLARQESIPMKWWRTAHEALGSTAHAVIGAVAANQHMPPRQTADIDFAVRLRELPAAEEAMRTAGWTWTGPLFLAGGLEGSAWEDAAGNMVDLLGIPGATGDETVVSAQDNMVDGIPHTRLPLLVVLKLLSGRGRDIGDLTTMLGLASEYEIGEVRAAVARLGTREDVDDMEQLVAAGRLEHRRPGHTPPPDRP
jgi:hypothetical protein